MNRRHFLKLAGSGLVVATAAPIVEPVRRFWQVGRGAPVGVVQVARVRICGVDYGVLPNGIEELGAELTPREMQQVTGFQVRLNYML